MTPILAALSRAWKALLIRDLAFSASFEARAFLISLMAALYVSLRLRLFLRRVIFWRRAFSADFVIGILGVVMFYCSNVVVKIIIFCF